MKVYRALGGMEEVEIGEWVRASDMFAVTMNLRREIEQLQEEKTKLENLAEEIQKSQAKWARTAHEWGVLADSIKDELIKECKVSFFNKTAAVVFLAVIILQNLGVIPCLK